MNFVKNPNLPMDRVNIVILDGRVDCEITKNLKNSNIEVIKTNKHINLYNAVSYHPDMFLHHLGEEYFVYEPNTDRKIVEKLKEMGAVLIRGETLITDKYPSSIAYNVARVGNLAFHNFKYTDTVLKNQLLNRGVRLVNVKQGYSKCSISVVNSEVLITSDTGIKDVCENLKIDVLLIEPDENIDLTGLNYGFIGGSSAKFSENEWAVSGDIHKLKSADKIIRFLEKYSINFISLSSKKVIDLGTIIPVGVNR